MLVVSSVLSWDPSILDNEFEEEFYDAVTELPEVQARRDGTDPRVDDYGFLRSRQDYEILFKAQDEFIAANANTTTQVKQEVYYDASTSGVTYYDDTGTVIHDYVPMTYFGAEASLATIVSNTSSARNHGLLYPHCHST